MDDLVARIAALSPEQRALFLARLHARGIGHPEPAPIRPRPEAAAAPLSFAQQRLWFLDQLEPGSTAYNMPVAVRLIGKLDSGALRAALERIVERHEALRTTFPTVEGTPLQVIGKATSLTFSFVELSGLAAPEREAEARRLATVEARRPFDLARGPLFRATLLRLGAAEHVLSLVMHHIVSDGWSMGVLFRELSALYAGCTEGRPISLPDLPIQYPDYALWQRDRLRGELLRSELAHWRAQLAGAPPALDLPVDHPRPVVQAHRGAKVAVTLNRAVSGALKSVGRQHGATLFMTLLAGFKALLARHSGQTDLVVGIPVAGRTRWETERLIGFFINSLALRTDLSGDPGFGELVSRVRETALAAYAHQELPFEKLVEELQPERDLSRTPLFQVFCNMGNLPSGSLQLPGLRIERFSRGGGDIRTKFDLTLYAREQKGEIRLGLAYDTSLFEGSTAASLLTRLKTLLEGVAMDPGRRLSALRLLTHEERRRRTGPGVLARPIGPCIAFPRIAIERSVWQRFAEQAARDPGHPAVMTPAHEWTYGELEQATLRVARALRAAIGATPGRVALLLTHDGPMIAALLGVLRAGHAFVPLDPAAPAARLARQLAHSGSTVLLTDGANRGQAASLSRDNIPVLDLDELVRGAAHPHPNGSAPAECSPTGPETLAYLLYTSGTTGEPKAVAQSHRNLLHWIRVYASALQLGPADRLTLLSSYGFDAAMMDIFGALLTGATLCPLDPRAEEPAGLIERMRRHAVTIYHSTPTLLRHLAGDLAEGEHLAPSVRAVVLGGELATRVDIELHRAHFVPDCMLVNGLGPTESTLALQYPVDQTTVLPRSTVPVGYPVEGVEVHLLDPAGHDAEVFGEIAIESDHVALGYWAAPGQTEASFRAGRSRAGTRMYLTGDLGRLLPDGAIEYRGRKDRQIKLRGHRIEPGEIEDALAGHAQVGANAVVLRDDLPGGPALVAYIVWSPNRSPAETAPQPGELRQHLLSRLPEYMVPQVYQVLDQLPLLPNGKLDYRRLPRPGDGGMPSEQYVAPRTPTEERIAAIWADVLHRDRVGVFDNFFGLGGHSLLGTRVISRVRHVLGVEPQLRWIFEAPTVAALAERVEGARRADPAGEPRLVRLPRPPSGTVAYG